MARRIFDFEAPERFVAGSVGEPGQRAFYLQARQGGAMVTVGLEKVQVAALAGRLSQLLDAVDMRFGDEALVEDVDSSTRDDRALDEPLVELFRVSVLGLAWDVDAGRVLIEAAPLTVIDPDPQPADEAMLRVHLDRARARDFVRRAAALVAAGRPTCPFCGQALEPTGHFCPRTSLN